MGTVFSCLGIYLTVLGILELKTGTSHGVLLDFTDLISHLYLPTNHLHSYLCA